MLVMLAWAAALPTPARANPWFGSSSVPSPEPFGVKRFCAACMETPMLLPMSVHDAPERRASVRGRPTVRWVRCGTPTRVGW